MKKMFMFLFFVLIVSNIYSMNEMISLTQNIELMRVTHLTAVGKFADVLHCPIRTETENEISVNIAVSKLTQNDWSLLRRDQNNFINKSFVWTVAMLPRDIQQKICVFLAEKTKFYSEAHKKKINLTYIMMRLPLLYAIENYERISINIENNSHTYPLHSLYKTKRKYEIDPCTMCVCGGLSIGLGFAGASMGVCHLFAVNNVTGGLLALFCSSIGVAGVGIGSYIGCLYCAEKINDNW